MCSLITDTSGGVNLRPGTQPAGIHEVVQMPATLQPDVGLRIDEVSM